MNTPRLIAIGGPSCSGKTSIARALIAGLPPASAAYLPLDSYYRDLNHLPEPDRAAVNFDEPGALEWPLVREHVDTLSRGGTVLVPEYDFYRHTRTRARGIVAAKPYIVLEGLFALHDPGVRNRCALLAYVDAPAKKMLERRIARDVRERGRSRESITMQYVKHVLPMAGLHVTPTRNYADLFLDGAAPPEEAAGRILDWLQRVGANL